MFSLCVDDEDGFATPPMTPTPGSDVEEDVPDGRAALSVNRSGGASSSDSLGQAAAAAAAEASASSLSSNVRAVHSVSGSGQRSVDRLYDKYLVKMSELQVLVGHQQEEWQQAHNLSHSSLHLVDRFNIDIQLHRRVAQGFDRRLPGAAVCADLPCLQLHIDEQKIAALRSCLKNLSQKNEKPKPAAGLSSKPSQFLSRPVSRPSLAASPCKTENLWISL